MLKLTVAMLAIALAGTASAAGWRSLTIDGSSEEAFAQSLEVFKDKLPLARRYAFGWALQDIWVQGAKDAEAAQREYTASEYFRSVDGLGYNEVVTLLDPTGDTEETRRREANAWENRYARNSGSDSMRTELLRARTAEYRPPVGSGNPEQQHRGGRPAGW